MSDMLPTSMCLVTITIPSPDWEVVSNVLLLQQIHLLTAADLVFEETAIIDNLYNYYLLCFSVVALVAHITSG